jgi:D-alanyl-D-alanine carboxypeptidase
MNQFLESHKNKIAIISSLALLILIILGAFFVSSLSENKVDKEEERLKGIAREQFQNLDLKAKAYIVYDSTRKKVIYSRNESAQLPLASLTKVMSALVALDLADRETIIDINTGNNFNPNDRNALVPGKWKLGDLLRLTLVSSSNSGINTISETLSSLHNFLGGKNQFIALMNERAKSLGLHQTYFLNESGLDINETLAGAYGSPIDMAKMFDHAVAMSPDIFGATRYDSIVINSSDGKSESAQNTNTKVAGIQGLVASKTGFTDLAQGNLVIAFDASPDTRLVVVVLGSTQEARFSDTETLTRAALAYYSLI